MRGRATQPLPSQLLSFFGVLEAAGLSLVPLFFELHGEGGKFEGETDGQAQKCRRKMEAACGLGPTSSM